MTIEDYNVNSNGTIEIWFTYDDKKYTVVVHGANASSLIEKIIESKDEWKEKR